MIIKEDKINKKLIILLCFFIILECNISYAKFSEKNIIKYKTKLGKCLFYIGSSEENVIEDFNNLEIEEFSFNIKNFNEIECSSIESTYYFEISGIEENIKYYLYDITENKEIKFENNKSENFKLGLNKNNKDYCLKIDFLESDIKENCEIILKIVYNDTVNELKCFNLIYEKDEESPKYSVEYSTNSWTNQDVIVKLKFSEEVKGVEDFLYKDGFYEKTISENKNEEFYVEDLAGNKTLVNYSVNWIDKIPPKILGIENQKTYKNVVYTNYKDEESGIDLITKNFYGDLILDSNQDFYSTFDKKRNRC